jgi:hypothetical protein
MIRVASFLMMLLFIPACGGQPPEDVQGAPEGVGQNAEALNYCNGVPCRKGTYCDGTSCIPLECSCPTVAHSRPSACVDDTTSCVTSCIYPWIDWDGVYSNGCERYGIHCYYPPYPNRGYCCYDLGGCWSL